MAIKPTTNRRRGAPRRGAAALRRERLDRGETQGAIAERIGITRSYLSMLERGNAVPPLHVGRAWLEAFGRDAGAADAEREFGSISAYERKYTRSRRRRAARLVAAHA